MHSKNSTIVPTKHRTWLRHTLARHMKSTIVIPALGAALIMAAPMIANAVTINVANETDLRNAILTGADNGDTIKFTIGFALTADLPPIPKSVIIDGNGFLLNANGHEAFYVNAGTTPTVQNLIINNGYRSIDGGPGGGIFSNANSGTPTSITLNGNVSFGSTGFDNGAVLSGNVDLYAKNANNVINDGIVLNGANTVYAADYSTGINQNHTNSLTSDVAINDTNASVKVGGTLNTTVGGAFTGQVSTINNSLTGNVAGAGGVGGTVDIGTDISSKTSGFFVGSANTVTNTLTGDVTLDGATSVVVLGNSSLLDGSGTGNSGTFVGSANTLNNRLIGDVTLTDGGAVELGGDLITIHSAAGFVGANTILNTITGAVTVTDGDVKLTSGTFNTTQQLGPTVNTSTNTINGNVIVNGYGNLNFFGDRKVDANIASNIINGTATLNNASDSVVKGTNNSITNGLTLGTDTSLSVMGGSNEHNDVTKLIIGHGDTANAGTGAIVNQLTVGGSGVTVDANPNTNSNAYYNFQRDSDHGYDIDSGHVYVGAYGTSNTADAQSIANLLIGNVTFANGNAGTDFDGNNNWLNSGGMVILGGADNNLTNSGTVVNIIVGNVDLHGGSRLHLGGDEFTGDANVGNSITNVVAGAVTADGNSFIAMWGENDSRLHNILGSTLTLTDNALLHTEGVDNAIVGGATLNGKSIAQVGGSGGSHTLTNNLASDFILNDSSQLQLGGTEEYFFVTPGLTNHIGGDVALNDTAQLKVLSGGSGGSNSALGSSNISGDLTLSNDNTFVVQSGSYSTITGLRVDGAGGADLGNATVQVNLIYNELTFGQQYSLVEAANGLNGTQFNSTVVTADGNGDAQYMPFLLWKPDYTLTSAYLTLLTQFNNAGETDNQRSFGQYLDDLVSDSAPGGITDTGASNDLYDTLQYLALQNDPNVLNDFMGDTYSAFDLAGYMNASRFSNRVALHALQSRDNDWVQGFALNASQGLSGAGSQMSLVKQMLNSRPALQLSANANPATTSSAARSGIWGDIAGDWLSNDGDSGIGSPDFNLNSKSVVLGYQGGSQKFTWGLAGGYHNGDLSFNNRSASGDADGWNVGLNGLWKGNSGVYLNGVLAYSKDDNSLRREDGLGTNTSDFGGHALSAQLELGKKFDHGKNINFTPYLSLLGMKYDRSSVSESGTGAGLNVGDASNSFFTSNLGVRVGRDFIDEKTGSKRGGLMLGVSWQHQFSDVDFPVTAALQNAVPGSSFQVHGTPLSKNGIGVQLGGYGRISDNILGFLNYSGSFSSNQKVNSVTAGVEYQF